MKKDNQMPQSNVGSYELDSSYTLSKKEKATPYYQSYWAAWLQRPFYEDPVEEVIVYPKPRRTFFVVLILVLTLAILALSALSFLGTIPQLALFEKIEDAGGEEAEAITIGADDIIYSTLKSFSLEIEEDYIFYLEALRNVDDVETPVKLAYYAIPVSLALTVIIAFYILIKAISALFRPVRRKFSYIILIMMLFSLLGVAGGFVWSSQPVAEIQGFVLRSGANMIVGFGYLAIIAVELIALIISLFAYRRKKVTGGK